MTFKLSTYLNMRYFFIFSFFLNFSYSQSKFSTFFESNQFELNKTELGKLENWIAANKFVKIVGVDGYCDEDGTVMLNDSLARKRINFIIEKIKNRIAIRSDFKSRNFGEQHQLSKNKSENRKVVLFFLEQKDLINEDKILGIKEIPKPLPIFPKSIFVINPNGTKSELILNIDFMKKIYEAKVGDKLKIENLNFQINTFAIVPESRPKLYELLLVMESNPKLKINILGHLCCMKADKFDLSSQRAKAIFSFLTINEIDKSRITYAGMGVSNPIFPIPEKTEMERSANRRVEIEVIEN